MKELLEAIRDQLQTDIDYVRDADVFITEDEDLVPEYVKFPAIGLKDGAIARSELPGGMLEITLDATVIPYVKLSKKAASVMGDDSTGKKGVLEMEDDILESLDENTLDITGVQYAFSRGSSPSEFYGSKTEAVQRKRIAFQYVKEEARP